MNGRRGVWQAMLPGEMNNCSPTHNYVHLTFINVACCRLASTSSRQAARRLLERARKVQARVGAPVSPFGTQSLRQLDRCQLAELQLPPVSPMQQYRLVKATETTAPRSAPTRLAYAPTVAAIQSLCSAADEGRTVNAATFNGVGTFDVPGLRVMRHLAEAATCRDEVGGEDQWLQNLRHPSLQLVKDALWNHPPVAQLGALAGTPVTPHLLSTMACERSLTDDAVFAAAASCMPADSNVLLLPCIAYDCTAQQSGTAQTLTPVAEQAAQRLQRPARFIAAIVHLPGHWAVAIADREQSRLFFGNTVAAYRTPTDLLKRVSTLVSYIEPFLADEPPVAWRPTQVELLNVPQQTVQQGPASCGVGVAMIIGDVSSQRKCPPANTWEFRNAAQLRLKLMVSILEKMV